MTEDIKQLETLVNALNQEAFAHYGEEHESYPFELRSTGDAQGIFFLGNQIWHSEDDQRQYVDVDRGNGDVGEDLEPIEPHVRSRINAFLIGLEGFRVRE